MKATQKQITPQKNEKRSHKFGILLAALVMAGLSARPAEGAAGRYAYVSDSGGNQILEFSINASSGVLTSIAACSSIASTAPAAAGVDPTGRFLYVVNRGAANAVTWFTIAPATGCLTATAGIGVGASPLNLAISGTGACLYVSNVTANTVLAYTINPLNGTQ